ncbi:uncharacterized protein [Apostichopus japonicus]|uniref:uncharacterized protein isoform X2 n=1 Tax=Stichopus japonicus TaxID=307972 RepID=UPI003AB5F7B1
MCFKGCEETVSDSRGKFAGSTSMADSDPEVGVGDAEGTFDFDVTKDHGLSSDSEEEEEDEDTDAPPPKKKKRFRPWKNLKRIFKKKKIMEPKTELKDDQQQKDEQENNQEQVVSTEQYLLSNNPEAPTKDNTSAGHSLSQEDISRRRTDSDEGLPLSPDSPALTFDLTTSSEQEISVHGSGAISPDVESRQHSQVHKGLYHPTPSPRLSLRNNSNDQSGSDFDSVTTSPTLNSDAAKHRIAIKPSARRPSSRIRSPQTTPTAFDFDANSLSFASETIDEETEMEEKSTMSIVYEKKDAEGFKEGKRPLNGILDQLIEESKEAYTYDIDPVEVPLSPTEVSSLSDKEENASIKESDRNFMFNSQSVKLEDANGDGLGDVAQNEVQDLTREEDISESKVDELVADDNPAEEGMERSSEIMGQSEGKGSDHGQIEMEVETSAEVTDDEIRLETKTEETEGVNLKDDEVFKIVQVENVKSESKEDEDEKTNEVGVEDDVKEEEEEEKEEDEAKVEDIKQVEVEVEDEEKKVVIIQKPSPSPRQRSPPQTRPRVSFVQDESNKEETKDLNGNEDRPVSVKDRILRLQSKSFTSSQPAALIKRSPRWTLPKSKPSSPSPTAVERKVTTPTPASSFQAEVKVTSSSSSPTAVERKVTTPTPASSFQAEKKDTSRSSSPTAVERKVTTPTPASSFQAEKKDTSRSSTPTAVERKVTTLTPASSFQAEKKDTSRSSSPTAVERKVTTPTPASSFQAEKKITSPNESKVEKVKEDTPEIKPTPRRQTPPVKVKTVNVSIRSPPPKETTPPPTLRRESKDENSNNKSIGGVKALIMRFQETQQQVSSTS